MINSQKIKFTLKNPLK